jgi:sporulation protein YqfC
MVRKKEVPSMGKRGDWMHRLAGDMSPDTAPAQPLVELCGERRVLIENHRGVSRYGPEVICIRVRYGEVAIRGCGLELARMTREQLVVCGRIDSISLIRRERS